ncbi:MAG: hypothetical protein N2510_02690 [Ignavibacteria bacterium]|nr:hypothetical protein [Ignavibacteria bacterium]
MSELSKKTIELSIELNEFSSFKIKNPDDISLLIEFSLNNSELFGEIIFIAKYLNGLGKILDKIHYTDNIQSRDETIYKIKDEYKKNILKFTDLLGKLLECNKNHSSISNLENKYLSLNQESMSNLASLIYDLSWVKKFYNSKRK